MFGDIYIYCTYIYTSNWSGSYSEEGPLFRSALPRFLYVEPYSSERDLLQLLACIVPVYVSPHIVYLLHIANLLAKMESD